MDKLTVFQVVVMKRGKEGKGDREDVPDVLLTEQPLLVLAGDAQKAALQGAMRVTGTLTSEEVARVEVLARPF